MSKPKLIVAYLCLVGGPLLGLLGILRAGRYLTPPLAVGGAWNVEVDFAGLANAACRELLGSISQPFFSIAQSGSNLAFSLNNPQGTILPGTIKDATVSLDTAPSLDSRTAVTECKDPRAIRLRAALSQQGDQRFLTGVLAIDGCATCAPIPFHAVRQGAPAEGDR